MRLSFIESSSTTRPPTSCIKSLSDETITTSQPGGAVTASVAITSSASKPATSSTGSLHASISSRASGSCAVSSSGCASRVAL
jgi:hypothetical protein